jgi:hypothetical protein
VSTSVHLQANIASLIGTKLAPSVKLIYGEGVGGIACWILMWFGFYSNMGKAFSRAKIILADSDSHYFFLFDYFSVLNSLRSFLVAVTFQSADSANIRQGHTECRGIY